MHDRPPARRRQRRRRRTAHEREQDRLRKREQRKRKRKGIIAFRGRASPDVIAAMVARNKFYYGMTEKKAETAARDPKLIADLAFEIFNAWAPHWWLKK